MHRKVQRKTHFKCSEFHKRGHVETMRSREFPANDEGSKTLRFRCEHCYVWQLIESFILDGRRRTYDANYN